MGLNCAWIFFNKYVRRNFKDLRQFGKTFSFLSLVVRIQFLVHITKTHIVMATLSGRLLSLEESKAYTDCPVPGRLAPLIPMLSRVNCIFKVLNLALLNDVSYLNAHLRYPIKRMSSIWTLVGEEYNKVTATRKAWGNSRVVINLLKSQQTSTPQFLYCTTRTHCFCNELFLWLTMKLSKTSNRYSA